MMNTDTGTFNASELSSRKLWQLINTGAEAQVSAAELREAIEELAARRHYLEELQRLGKLGGLPQGD